MSYELDISEVLAASQEWDRSCLELRAGMRAVVGTSAEVTAGAMKFKAPRRDGGLQDSITHKISKSSDTQVTAIVRPNISYAKWVVDGTEPHLIEAHLPGVLRFDVGGTTVFSRFVHHPGTKPNDFVGASIPAAESVLYREGEALVHRAFWRFLS